MTDNPIAMFALKRKRAEIAGKIADFEVQLEGLRADLLHVDHTLRLFDPEIEPHRIPPKRPKIPSTGYFGRGELTRRIYDVLRQGETLSAADIVGRVLSAKKLPTDDKHLNARMASQVLVRLSQLAAKGTVTRVGAGIGVRWRLITD